MNKAWGLGVPTGSVPVWDRGFRYGMSVFETVAVLQGQLLFSEAHERRLLAAAEHLLGIDAAPFWREAILRTRDELSSSSGILRIYITAGPGAPKAAVSEPCGYALFESTEILSGPGPGIRVCFSRSPMAPAPGGWKTGNYWANIAAAQDAEQRGFQEAILLNPAGEVISCAFGNLFIARGDTLATPRLEAGARNGAVRDWVLAQSPCEEACLLPSDIQSADECFVTNSRIGICRVGHVEETPFQQDTWASSLAQHYRQNVLGR